ncbi:SsgA family sporulation/cell division regulator [Allokutzneria sp. NRRL B-24872]|uniref:SsgA family sporulation/cell division regulator n=1 Tax=Allokutzneria sp. NRRL B-24872 TaxID=1137961 RepID=UPI000A384E48|nr:SsgA family sporulation/cell division regulator [Allokutzneria sp. NRRL B-24872]
MNTEHTEIRSAAMFDLLTSTPVAVEVEFSYSTRDPYAIQVLFNPYGDQSVQWILARDLLADGLLAEAGEGDVRIWPVMDELDVVVLEFTTPAGQARFGADPEDLVDFLNETYELVEPGKESRWFDFEQEMAMLSGDAKQ